MNDPLLNIVKVEKLKAHPVEFIPPPGETYQTLQGMSWLSLNGNTVLLGATWNIKHNYNPNVT